MSTVSTVAVAGITGKLGTLVTQSLLKASPDVKIRGLCRDKAKLPAALRDDARVTIVEGSSDDAAALRAAVRGSDIVVCCYLGPDELMIDGQKRLIDAAVAEKVPRYMASDYAIDYRKLELGQLPSKDPMKHVQRYLEGRPIAGVHVLIGAFIEVFWAYLGCWDAQKNEITYWGTGDEKWDFTTYGTCAEYMAAVALDASAKGFLAFRGDHVSIRELAALLEKRYGSAPTLKHLGTLDELRPKLEEIKAKGPVAMQDMPPFYIYYISNGQTRLEDIQNDRYPSVKPVSAEQYFAQADIRAGQF